MLSIEFHRRRSSLGRDRAGSLFIRIIYRRRARSVTLPFRLYPSEWDPLRKRIAWENASSCRIAYLTRAEKEMSLKRNTLWQIVERLEQEGPFTLYDIVAAFRRKYKGTPLVPFARREAEALRRTGRPRTARAYESAVTALVSYTGNNGMLMGDLTASLLEGFERHLSEKKLMPNTISFYMRNLRVLFNKAVRKGLADPPRVSPFENVSTGIYPTVKRALSVEEIASLAKLSTTPTASLFLFSFYARGMSFVDMAFLKKSDIRQGVIRYRRRKTGKKMEVGVSREMEEIIRYFSERVKDSPYVFPLVSGNGEEAYRSYLTALSRQNRHLKLLAAECGLERTAPGLSTHMARHSWATIARSRNVPLAVISESLGHSSERTTAIYLDAFDRKTLDGAAGKVARAISKAC